MDRQYGPTALDQGNGRYKQLVANRVAKFNYTSRSNGGTSHRASTSDNPADLASRGGSVQSLTLWQREPEWLQTKQHWPKNKVMQATPASEKEAKITREILNVQVAKIERDRDKFDDLLERVSLRRTLRVGVWIRRFALS